MMYEKALLKKLTIETTEQGVVRAQKNNRVAGTTSGILEAGKISMNLGT